MSNKSLTILKIGILTFIAIILLFIMFFFINFKGFKNWSKIFSYKDDYKLLFSEEYELSSFNFFKFDLVNADLSIRYSDTDSIKLEIYDNDKSNFSVSTANEKLIVDFSVKKFNSFCIGICYGGRKVIMYLPKDFAGNIDVNSASGDINIDDYSYSDVKVSTASGDVNLRGSKVADISTASGDVNAQRVMDLKLKTISGDMEIHDVTKLFGSTTSGEMELYKLNESIDFESVSGDIDIESANISVKSRLSTVSGEIDIEGINLVYINASSLSGDISVMTSDRKSDIEFIIKTTSGDIDVQ